MSEHRIILLSILSIPYFCYATSFEEHFQKANDLFHNSQHDQAIEQYKQALELNTDCHQAYFNMGLVYLHQKKYEQAIEAQIKAFTLCPTYIKAIVHAGNAYQELKKYDQAVTLYKQGLDIDKNSFDCLAGLARAYNNMSKFEDSITYFRAAHALKTYDHAITLELANTLNMAQHTQEALQLYHAMLDSTPNDTSILYNIAYTLKKLNRIDQALPYYEKVLALDPENTEAHFSLSLAYLGMGNFERGWQEYEWRWKRESQGGPRVLSKPLWNGSSLDNKTILLHAEQGLGDTFQFIRYAQLLKKEYNVKIILASQDPLIPLMKLCPYLDRVVSLYDRIPPHDVQAPLLSMPYLMKTRLETIPHAIPYLYADPALTQQWKEKLAKGLKIGICWQGNSNYSTHFLRTAVAAKSVQLQQFMPLLTMENITVYNLQKITGEEQIQAVNACPSFVSFDKDFDQSNGRFMDTAAVIKNLDLMITIDTSMAHLAAGLGITTWVLLPEPADWRWMTHRSDTPWYPNMRLFRQPIAGDWDSVIQKIVDELRLLQWQKNELNTVNETIAHTQQRINELENRKVFTQELAQLGNHLYRLIENRKQMLKK